ncbi:MAG: hypothetical protein C0398_07660 [Coprothermobacter sp.]|nr:hypothetical protein [Coprothermobacter sp.]
MRKVLATLVALSLLMSMFTGVFASVLDTSAAGPAAVSLGTAGNFAILTKTGISTTGTTHVTGDIGVSPAAASTITGFALVADAANVFSTSSLVTGKVYAADYAPPTPANMTTAVSNMEAAYTAAAGRTPGVGPFLNIGGGTVAGQTLVPGVYTWGSNVTITTDLTLSGGANDVWVFQITGTLDIATGKRILLVGGAQAKNIFWQVADAVTLKPGSHIEGIILAKTNIAMQNGATLNGRALAQTAVTLIATTVSAPASAPAPVVADVAITKTANSATPHVGTQVSFTVTVTNNGSDTATGVVVTDSLPVGLTYVSSTASQGTYVGSTWTAGTLASGGHATLEMLAAVVQAGNLTNTAVASSVTADANLANNTASVTVNAQAELPTPRADLVVTKGVSNQAPLVGAQIVFTVRIQNAGPDTATNVVVNDALPNGLTFVSFSATQGLYVSSTGIWTVGTLANGQTATLTMTTLVQMAANRTNTAVGSSTVTDPNLSNNTASVALNPIAPPLGLHLNPLALPLQICRQSEIVVDESWTGGTAPFTWTVNFGDGTPVVTGSSTDRRLVVRHLYAVDGLYAISVTVTDSPGKTGSVAQTLTAVNCNVPQEVYHHTFVVGYPDGMFKPERNVSRAEVATALSRALGLGWSNTNPSYPDVPATHWASGYIQIMTAEGIMEGDASGTFRPDAFITRAEAAAVLLRMLKVEPFHNLLVSSFRDVPATNWALGYIESMQKYGLITGYPDGTYKPDAHILRSEFTAIADRALGREISTSSQVTGLSGDIRYPDVPATHWAYLYILEASTPHTVEQANRLNRTIVLKSKTIPLFSDGTSPVTIRKVGDILTAIVPVDGLRPDRTAPAARKVTVVVTIKLAP